MACSGSDDAAPTTGGAGGASGSGGAPSSAGSSGAASAGEAAAGTAPSAGFGAAGAGGLSGGSANAGGSGATLSAAGTGGESAGGRGGTASASPGGGAGTGGEATGGGAGGTGGASGSGGSEGGAGSGGGGTPAGGKGVVGKPIGFATLNGGTSGGAAGPVVTAKTFAELKSYGESASPYVILVEGTLTNGAVGGKVSIKSNKSLVGVGSSAFLSGVGLEISSASNIIIQNLRVTLVGITTPTSINDGDAISIMGTSRNIWIDHCEVFSIDPAVQTNKDLYDGLIDIKGQTGFITISWTYWHDHHKGGLVGSSDEDLFADRKLTLHHNYYRNVKLRVPMYRGAIGHFFNNYVVGAEDASEIRANTCLRIEKNYYEALHYSIYTPNDAPGKAERIDNVEVSRTARAYPDSCVADIAYDYQSALTSTTQDVKTVVPQGADVGKI